MRLNLFVLFLIVFLLTGVFVSDAYAYIDPGSGSIIIQIIVGALVGVGVTIKLYWHRFKEKILRHDSRKDE